MKTLRLLTGGILMSAIISCQHDSQEEIASFQNNITIEETAGVSATGKAKAGDPGPCNPNAYEVVLESRALVNGNWEWIWSVRNPNPGNGSNGTAKDLSHWGIRVGSCVDVSSIIGAAYSDDGAQWTSFTPVVQPDPSQDCLTTPTLKFDYGTSGSDKTYYRLIISQEYPTGSARAYYKSGGTCCTFNITAMGCSGGPIEIVE
jgi:hypothetical protein